jgi:signal transduction histidine kinase
MLEVLLVFGIWTLLGLFDAVDSLLRYRYEGKTVIWWSIVLMGLSLWYGWALLAQGVFFLGDRFPPEDRPRPRNLAIHLVASMACAMLKILFDYPIIEMFYCPAAGWMPLSDFYAMAVPDQFHKYVLIYWAILGVHRALAYYRRYRDQKRHAAQLQLLLAEAQLQTLRMQLHPHFLFNTLNSISALIHQNVPLADRMIARLGDLLRLSLANAERTEVPLREELDFLEAYLEIEQARLGPRMRVAFEIAPDALDVPVPYLLLQPLAENAVKYAIAPRREGGRLEIRARLVPEGLLLEVSDDGPGLVGMGGSTTHGTGIGLANTRSRLWQMYGDRYLFKLRPSELGGVCATIRLPLAAMESEVVGFEGDGLLSYPSRE